jgi:hypothetical protein
MGRLSTFPLAANAAAQWMRNHDDRGLMDDVRGKGRIVKMPIPI